MSNAREISINTRCDSFGDWHATIEGPVDAIIAPFLAQAAIVNEIRQREASGGLGPGDIVVKELSSFAMKNGMNYHFVEEGMASDLQEMPMCEKCGDPIDYCQGHGVLG